MKMFKLRRKNSEGWRKLLIISLITLSPYHLFSLKFLHAIELELQENRGERGTVGFVDMDRVFKEFPETKKAKEAFETEIKNRKEALRRKKSELKKLKGELEELKTEKTELLEALARLQAQEAAKAAAQAVSAPEQTVADSTAPVQAVSASTAPAVESSTAPPWVGLPGISLGAAVAPSTGTAVSTEGVSAQTVSVGAPASRAAVEQAATQVAISSAVLAELDQKIETKSSEIGSQEKAVAEFQRKAQKELLDMESRKVQIILGKIYPALDEVAREEGVSVIVDKTSILFGQSAVDLTEKLLKRLQGG